MAGSGGLGLPSKMRSEPWPTCWESDIAGPVNLSAPNPVTNREFTRALASVLRRPAALAVPQFGPRLLLGRELADGLLFSSTRAHPAALSDADFEFRHPELARALEEILH